jgi:hypothetical protein
MSLKRTNVYADPDDLALIMEIAARRGVPEAEIIREGIHLAAMSNQVIAVAHTSGIIAVSDRNARESAACRAAMQKAGTIIISPVVLTEVDHLAKAASDPTRGPPLSISSSPWPGCHASRSQKPASRSWIRHALYSTSTQASTWTWLAPSTSCGPPSTGPTQCSRSTAATSARCDPSPRTSGSGSCPTTYSRHPHAATTTTSHPLQDLIDT